MADITKTIGIVFQGTDNTSSTISGIEASLKGIDSAAKSAAPSMDEAASASSRLGASSVSVRELSLAMQALAGSVVVKEFIDANVAIENFGRAMTVVTGSTGGAAESLDYVRKTSNMLGLEITGAAQNFVSLPAAAKGTTLEGQATRDIFEAVSSAMSLLGKSTYDTNGALLAINQIISKGTVSSEELRGQIGEKIPGAFQIAARAIGVTTQELSKMLEEGQVVATDFLPAFAAELNKTFGNPTYVVTFNAELNRLINSLKELAVAGGDAGIFGLLTEGLRDLANITKTTVVEINFLSATFTAVKNFLATGGEDWDEFKRAMRAARIEAGIANAEIAGTNESVAEQSRLLRQAKDDGVDWANAVNESTAETQRLFGDTTDAITSTNAAYKTLGIDAKKTNADFIGALETLVSSAISTTADVQKALTFVIPKIQNAEELERFSAAAAQAASDGKITWESWAIQVDKASEAFLKNTGYVGENTKEISKQADQAKRAEENAAKMALELEKLASNERIKAMEFSAEINVARIQADAEKVVAAFDSINTGIESTESLLSSLFGMFDKLGSLDSSARNALFSQIDKENELRQQSSDLQTKLTEAQIEYLNAQTKQLQAGDALIKVDGAGLQPHLEAFMWEILRAIQVRANRDGLAFLLGV